MTTASITAPSSSQFEQPRESAGTTRRIVIPLAVFLLLLYACFPTKNHYWDGIGFALNMEGFGDNGNGEVLNAGEFRGISHIYFNPNHLLYNLTGYFLYVPLRGLIPGLRAHDMLRAISMVLSAATACLLFLALNRWCRNARLSVWLTLLMALSATWWKFSTDADAYVPSTFLLMLAAYRLTNPDRRPAGWKIGLLHAMAMLLHQISICFLPAAAVGLWLYPNGPGRRQNQRAVLEYLAAAGVPVAAAYAWVWFGVLREGWSAHRFLAWLASNGGDVFSYQAIGANALETLRSLMRVFFGGRVRLALEFDPRPLLIVMVVVMLASLGRLVWTLRQQLLSPRLPDFMLPDDSGLPAPKFLIAWTGAFTAFLFVWLTEYPYYRLFYLPAMIFLIGSLLRRSDASRLGAQAARPLAAFVVFMAAFNFGAYIYPYTQEAATPPIQLAHQASTVWKGNEVILYRDFTTDNWMMRYFSPHTTWIKEDLNIPRHLASTIRAAQARGQAVWLDTTLMGQFKTTPEMREWFQQFGGLSKPWGLATRKHYIQFSRVQLN